MPTPDRRSAERMPVDCTVCFFHLPPTSSPPVFHALNLTLTGACIQAPIHFVPGAVLSFHLVTPDNQVADIHAQVIHSEEDNTKLYRVGVQFTHLAEYDRNLVARQIDRVRPSLQ
ncbi:MAG: PilZ domain-containing protein [Chloroflexi bacterium]|nr:PilZ domain-containing protein [Chloroflexota bacterium]